VIMVGEVGGNHRRGSDIECAPGDESFDLDEGQIAALRESIDEANRGELVPLDEVLSGR